MPHELLLEKEGGVGSYTFDADSKERILISRLGARYTNPRDRMMLVAKLPTPN